MSPLIPFLAGSVAALFSSFTASAQTTWFVDASQAISGDGSQGAPFKTIGEATVVADYFDEIMVLPGVYAEQVETPARHMIAPGGPDLTTIQAVADGPAVCSASADLTIEGFSIVGSPDHVTMGIGGSNSVLDYWVFDCVIRDHEHALTNLSGLCWLKHTTVAANDFTYTQQFIDDAFWSTGSIISGGPLELPLSSIITSTLIDVVGQPGIDPGFWNAPDDLHLRPGSVAIIPGGKDLGALPFDPTYVPAPMTFCTAKTSSNECTPTIGFAGGPAGDGSLQPFVIDASGVDELKNGHLFFGLAPGPFPFLGGWHCIQPPTQRTPIQNSGAAGGPCSGSFALDFNAFVQGGGTPHVTPGTMVTAQYWYRDPADHPFGSMLTDAVEFGYGL